MFHISLCVCVQQFPSTVIDAPSAAGSLHVLAEGIVVYTMSMDNSATIRFGTDN